jgi:hypothetical protein
MTTAQLREQANKMTKKEMIAQRDFMESNWSEFMRPSMQILSLACINKFETTLVNLDA